MVGCSRMWCPVVAGLAAAVAVADAVAFAVAVAVAFAVVAATDVRDIDLHYLEISSGTGR